MKLKSLLVAWLAFLMSATLIQAQPYYFIVPGTISYRLDGSVTPAITEPLQLRRQSPGYYGYDRVPSGARTPFDSSPYLDFALFTHESDPNAYTDPTEADIVEDSNPNAAPLRHWLMNFRLSYPPGFDPENPGTERYPIIIMMHGAGERGDCWNNNCYSTNGDYANLWNNDHNLVHGGRQHLVAQQNGRFPGFVVFPQNRNGWVSGPFGDNFASIWKTEVLLEQLMREYPIDRLRIYMHGLSNGAEATWKMLNSRPDLYAAAAAMSGSSLRQAYPREVDQLPTDLSETMAPIPLWQFQGGEDARPTPEATENALRLVREEGGTPKYTLYPNLGHATWNTAYAEPDFFEWFQQYDKTHIHSFFGVNQVCEGDPVDVTLSVSKGFIDYEWQKEISGVQSDIDLTGAPRKDRIQATEVGRYRVRIKYLDLYQSPTEKWSEWSEWFEITTRPRPDATITANGPTALPGLNLINNVTLSVTNIVPNAFNYTWYRDGVVYEEGEKTTSINVNAPNEYHVVVTDDKLCDSNPSNSIYVSTTPYSGALPFEPTNLRVQPDSETSLNLFWDKNSTDELGFEIYRRVGTSGPWEWVTTTGAGAISYTDQGLVSGVNYCYIIRAYNENGASLATLPSCGTTIADNEPPSPPQNLSFDHFNYFENRINVVGDLADVYMSLETDKAVISWDPADDNAGIDHYNIYREDGTLLGTTSETSFVIEGLISGEVNSYYVTASDAGANESEASNGIVITNVMEGLYFNMYAGGTWDFIREYSNWDLYAFSTTDRVRVDAGYSFYNEGDYFAYDLFGKLWIENAGDYQFRLASDDGSQLYLGSERVIDHDGLHGTSNKDSDIIAMSAGAQTITVKYFERTGGQSLTLSYKGPDTGDIWTEVPASQYRSHGSVPVVTPPSGPTGLSASASGTDYFIDLDWSYPGDVSSVRFEIWRSTNNLDFDMVGSTGYGELQYNDNGLQASTTYFYKVNAFNENGASTQSNVANATTIADGIPPTTPSNLAVQGVTATSIVLSWEASSDNIGVDHYDVYMDGNPVGTTSNLSFTAVSLESNTEYSFYVIAQDAAGNSSGNSNIATGRTDESGSLPVELISFDALPNGDEVVLKWVTASELNNEKFLVERGTHAGNFQVIGGLDGSGTTSERREYKWVDRQPVEIAYYRLKQVDFDGTYSYSNVIRVVLDKSNLEELKVFPNPTSSDQIFIRGYVPSDSDKVIVRLIDVMGKTYLNTTEDPNTFLNGVKLEPYQQMPVGVYILVLSDGSQVTQKRIVIK